MENIYWWNDEDENIPGSVQKTVDRIRQDQVAMRTRDMRHMRMYRNLNTLYMASSRGLATDAPLSLNITRTMVNEMHSLLVKDRIRDTFLTDGASRETRKKASQMEKFADGMHYKHKTLDHEARAILDMLVLGTGVLKVSVMGGELTAERVFTPELVVDTVEGMYQDPQNWYQIKYIDRFKLAGLFPDHKQEILETAAVRGDEDEEFHGLLDWYGRDNEHLLMCVEAYHLANGSEPGKCVLICGDNVLLSSKPWKHDWAPYVVGRWTNPPLGFFGMGLCEELAGIQAEMNRLMRKIQSAQHLVGHPYILAERSSGVGKGSIRDVPGSFIYYTNREPRVITPQTVHPEIYAQLDRLYARAREVARIPQSGAGESISGKLSGRSQLVHRHKQNSTLAAPYQERERIHTELTRLMLRRCAEIPGYSVKIFGDDAYDVVDFKKDIGLAEDDYEIRVMPTAFISGTPEGQLELAERMIQGGLVPDPEAVLDMMGTNNPDIRRYVKKATSPRRLVEMQVEALLDGDEKQRTPEPHMNLDQVVQVAQELYLEAKEEGVPEERLRRVRQYMALAVRMKKGPQVEAPPGQPLPGGPVPVPAAEPAPMAPQMPPVAPPAPMMPGGQGDPNVGQ